ncbi:HD-GYP domain-containing protein [Inmirania thermothiophila]|uniref:HD-GYP domain-containing protein (C-di-GMP phosphodiesterase class II) n=1 Tax=Inmirania thermothiophila TaxID=1750597 RepID=A0A3N1Y8A0_9GAMM|nr:HD-GYP domain-containing protein [Inmirania thermothiophila]ROR35015.1 HD-GYP domain-containing protein (c-di-GMP phosphodiesterase class II) [Inmirania thermothiophila]
MKHWKVPVGELAPGMFVCELDRPWLDTPFLFQGFLIESEAQIEELARYCRHVYVDPLRSDRERILKGPAATRWRARLGSSGGDDLPRPTRRYEERTTVEEELPAARTSWSRAEEAVDAVFDEVAAGREVNVRLAREAVRGLAESVLRNPDALIWMTRLRRADRYTWGHAVSVSIYLMAFARHLGLPRAEIELVGLGGLLMDVGKVRLPRELLDKSGRLSEEEHRLVREHVLYSVEALRASPRTPPAVVEIAYTHHERSDGSGYPRGIEEPDIPLHGRMAAIADTFDAMTSVRPYAPAVSAYDALQDLYEWRGTLFHAGLVEQFIQAVGIYPPGTLVELSGGEVGVVLAQRRTRQLRPRVLVLLGPDKARLEAPTVLDLLQDPVDARGEPQRIRRALEPGAYGLDPGEYFL